MPNIKAAMTIGVFVLVVALVLPSIIGAADSDQTAAVEITQDETIELTDRLSIRADDVNPSGDNATLTVFNSQGLNQSQQLLNDSQTKTFVVDGYATNVTLDNTFLSEGSKRTSRLAIAYSPYFGWDSGARLFFQNLELLLVLVGGIMVLGLAGIASDW